MMTLRKAACLFCPEDQENTDLLVALEDSDIRADAFDGQGGNIRITTQGDFRSPNSDITASSKRGNSDTIWVDWLTLNPGKENRSSLPVSTNPTAPVPAPIVEAQGWVINNLGEVVLTATAPSATLHSPWISSATCHTPETSF